MKRSRVATVQSSSSVGPETKGGDAPGAPEATSAATREAATKAATEAATEAATGEAGTPASLPAKPMLLGTLNYVVATLRCTLAYLDSAGLGALAMVSHAHQSAIVQHMAAATDLFICRRLDADQQLVRLTILGVYLASRHARRLQMIAASPAATHLDEAVEATSGISGNCAVLHDVHQVDLTRLQQLLLPIVARCRRTLRHTVLPAWLYSSNMLGVMVGCSELESLHIPVDIHGYPASVARCVGIVRANAGLKSLALSGVSLSILAVATGLSLTDLDMTHRGAEAPQLDLLGGFTALRRLKIGLLEHGAIQADPAVYWRRCHEALAVALPMLRSLEYFNIDAISDTAVNLRDVEWRFAPSLTHLELEDTWGMPRMIGASVRKFSTTLSPGVRLVRLAAGLPGLEECCVKIVVRKRRVQDRIRGALRGALKLGLFKNLRVALLNGIDGPEIDGPSILGSETLNALVRGCPLLEDLDARVHHTFCIDHLEALLALVPHIRQLNLAFSDRVLPSSIRESCVSKHTDTKTTASAPIVLTNLEGLCLPVASDDLLGRLVCPRLQRLHAMDGAIALTRWPRFPALIKLQIQLAALHAAALEASAASATSSISTISTIYLFLISPCNYNNYYDYGKI